MLRFMGYVIICSTGNNEPHSWKQNKTKVLENGHLSLSGNCVWCGSSNYSPSENNELYISLLYTFVLSNVSGYFDVRTINRN